MKKTLTIWRSTRSVSWSWVAFVIWVVEATWIFASMMIVLVRRELQEPATR